ncbi:hypothetical protein [Thermococcus sibiricus]|uniref:hypothetical protein n=1 Tax=Thermococcus sibiricus TaxID=172049 RepID=UPI00164F8BDF|nr:hypothetical protein [Thermococcus sibiricus]
MWDIRVKLSRVLGRLLHPVFACFHPEVYHETLYLSCKDEFVFAEFEELAFVTF